MSDLIRKVQLTEYEMLKVIDEIAKKHNIRYFIGQGTLLGAAKYKKFIPWDDDIDLIIEYKELKKLISVFKEEAPSEYIITNCFIEKHFPVAWTKVRNSNTLSRPVKYKELPINWGICVDLFPIYSVSNISFIRKLEYFMYKVANKLILAEFTKYEENHGLLVRLLEKIPICIRHLYLKAVIGILNLHGDKTKYVMVSSKGVKIVKRDIVFGKINYLQFEDGVFPAINDYDTYLTINYGDWRADLPDEKKKGHELDLGDIEWKFL